MRWLQKFIQDDPMFGPATFTLPLCYFSEQIEDLNFRLHYSHLIPASCAAVSTPFAITCQRERSLSDCPRVDAEHSSAAHTPSCTR